MPSTTATVNSDLQQIAQAGGFRILRRLGEGGFATVFLAYDEEVKESCALKIPKKADDGTSLGARAEAKRWLALGPHPHVVAARRIATVSNRTMLALELVRPLEEGIPTLRALLARRHVRPEQSLRILIQIIEGLQHASQHGLLAHRDLKPENILVDRAGSMKVSDFGLAEFSSRRWRELATLHGAPAGTLLYMAPEQFRAGLVDAQADLYSLGIIAYQLFSGGRYPYDLQGLDSPRACESMHQAARARPLAVPEWQVIVRFLAKSPSERPNGYGEANELLRAAYLTRTDRPYKSNAVTGDREDIADLTNRALSLSHLGHPKAALCMLADVLPLITNSAEQQVNLGVIYAEMGDLDAAQGIWTSVVERFPQTAGAWSNLGSLHFNAARFVEAIAFFNRSLELEPESYPVLISMGIAKVKTGDKAGARPYFERACELGPGEALAHYNFGLSAFENGEFADAERALEDCVRLDPRMAVAYLYLAECARALDKPEAATAWTKKALDIDPKCEQQVRPVVPKACVIRPEGILHDNSEHGDERSVGPFRGTVARMKRRWTGAADPSATEQLTVAWLRKARAGAPGELPVLAFFGPHEDLFEQWLNSFRRQLTIALDAEDKAGQVAGLRRFVAGSLRRLDDGTRVVRSSHLDDADRRVLFKDKRPSDYWSFGGYLNVLVVESLSKVLYGQNLVDDLAMFFIDLSDVYQRIFFKSAARVSRLEGQPESSTDDAFLTTSETSVSKAVQQAKDLILAAYAAAEECQLDLNKLHPLRLASEPWRRIASETVGVDCSLTGVVDQLALAIWKDLDAAIRGQEDRWLRSSDGSVLWRLLLGDIASVVFAARLAGRRSDLSTAVRRIMTRLLSMCFGESPSSIEQSRALLGVRMALVELDASPESVAVTTLVVRSLAELGAYQYLKQEERLGLFTFLKFLMVQECVQFDTLPREVPCLPVNWQGSYLEFLNREEVVLRTICRAFRSQPSRAAQGAS